jgi:hypothetical protein
MNRTNFFLTIMLIFFCSAFCIAQEPSTDRKNPTPFTGNTVEGEYDGLETTHYYSFIANKGEVEITATAETQNYSKLVDFELLDETGRQLQLFSVVGKETPQTDSAKVRIIRKQRVILRVYLREDNDIKHLKYQVQLDGAVEFENSAATPSTAGTPQMTTGTPPATTQTPSEMMGGSPKVTAAEKDVRSCLPQTGTLVITTSSGESYEVDLKNVVKAAVKP